MYDLQRDGGLRRRVHRERSGDLDGNGTASTFRWAGCRGGIVYVRRTSARFLRKSRPSGCARPTNCLIARRSSPNHAVLVAHRSGHRLSLAGHASRVGVHRIARVFTPRAWPSPSTGSNGSPRRRDLCRGQPPRMTVSPSAPLTPAEVRAGACRRPDQHLGSPDLARARLPFRLRGMRSVRVESSTSGGKGNFRAAAHGDLDGDGVVSPSRWKERADHGTARCFPGCTSTKRSNNLGIEGVTIWQRESGQVDATAHPVLAEGIRGERAAGGGGVDTSGRCSRFLGGGTYGAPESRTRARSEAAPSLALSVSMAMPRNFKPDRVLVNDSPDDT